MSQKLPSRSRSSRRGSRERKAAQEDVYPIDDPAVSPSLNLKDLFPHLEIIAEASSDQERTPTANNQPKLYEEKVLVDEEGALADDEKMLADNEKVPAEEDEYAISSSDEGSATPKAPVQPRATLSKKTSPEFLQLTERLNRLEGKPEGQRTSPGRRRRRRFNDGPKVHSPGQRTSPPGNTQAEQKKAELVARQRFLSLTPSS